TFELLIYTDRNTSIPEGWDESGPQFVINSADIKLRSFSTTVHRVDHVISYKMTS
ncbi:MAD2 (Mitotic arrest deficient) 1, partial [Fasciolopsis buskii]